MTESRRLQEAQHLSEDSEEFDSLLGKEKPLHKKSMYSLQKIPRVPTSASEEKDDLPLFRLSSEDLKNLVGLSAPAPEDDDVDDNDNENALKHSDHGYLPATLRAAISVSSNNPQTVENKVSGCDTKLVNSPPLPKRKKVNALKKKPPRNTIRRSKSDRPTKGKDGVFLAQSLRLKPSETFLQKGSQDDDCLSKSLHVNPMSEQTAPAELKRLYKSEEFKKSENRGGSLETIKRRKSEDNLLRREKGRSRSREGRPSSRKQLHPSKDSTTAAPSETTSRPASSRRRSSKIRRSRPKNTPPSNSQSLETTKVINWKRTSEDQPRKRLEQEAEAEPQKRKLKKSRSLSAKPRRSKSTSKKSLSNKSISPSPESAKDNKKVGADRKKPSPRQLERKKSYQKQKQVEPLSPETVKGNKKVGADRKKPSPHQLERKKSYQKQKQAEPLSPAAAEDSKKVGADRKKPSPHQLERKKSSQKQKQAEPQKHKPQKSRSAGSTDAKTKKTVSRRTHLLTSKATTPSCRNLLRTINKINDDRLSMEKLPQPINELSRSTLSTSQTTSLSSTDFEDTNHSGYSYSSYSTPLEEIPKIPKPDDQDEEQAKHKRTKSAPLNQMNKNKKSKSFNAKISKSRSGNALFAMGLPKAKKEKSSPCPKRSIKDSLSSSFRSFGWMIDGKAVGKSKKKIGSDDTPTRTANRSKDNKGRRMAPQRSKSDSSLKSLKMSPQKRTSASQYGLMISEHMNCSDKDYLRDIEIDDEDSFCGEEDVEANNKDLKVLEASNPEQMKKSEQLSSPDDLPIETSEIIDKVMKLEDFASSHIVSTTKLKKNLGGNNNSAVDKFSKNTNVTNKLSRVPKQQPRCLQIDFSQVSEHGTSGNIVVRSKKLGGRVNKSNRELHASGLPTMVT